jgi:hypothetical protein
MEEERDKTVIRFSETQCTYVIIIYSAMKHYLRLLVIFFEPEPGMLSLWLRMPGPKSASIRTAVSPGGCLSGAFRIFLGHFRGESELTPSRCRRGGTAAVVLSETSRAGCRILSEFPC